MARDLNKELQQLEQELDLLILKRNTGEVTTNEFLEELKRINIQLEEIGRAKLEQLK